MGNSLIGVDTLGRLFAAKVLLEELLDLGDRSGTTNENDFVDIPLVDISVLENLLDGLHGLPKEVHLELFKLGPGEGL